MSGELWIVSVKGVLIVDGHVALAKNDRNEWELPGGRLDPDDASPTDALRREYAEELGIVIDVGAVIDSYIFEPIPNARRLIITYLCAIAPRETGGGGLSALRRSEEHLDVRWMRVDSLAELDMPDGYRRSIAAATI